MNYHRTTRKDVDVLGVRRRRKKRGLLGNLLPREGGRAREEEDDDEDDDEGEEEEEDYEEEDGMSKDSVPMGPLPICLFVLLALQFSSV